MIFVTILRIVKISLRETNVKSASKDMLKMVMVAVCQVGMSESIFLTNLI